MNPDITQHSIGLALALGISVLLGALVLLAAHIRGVILMRRLRAKHRREWEVLHAQADAMFAQIQRRADSANQDTP